MRARDADPSGSKRDSAFEAKRAEQISPVVDHPTVLSASIGNRAFARLVAPSASPGMAGVDVHRRFAQRPSSIQRVDTVLGPGARAAITAGMNPNSPYTQNDYLRDRANQLVGAGFTQVDARNLMVAMGAAIQRRGKFSNCVTLAANMAAGQVPFALLRPLILNHAIGMPAANHPHLTSLATNLRAWAYAHVNTVMTGPNPNGFDLTEMGNIARHVQTDSAAEALAYIGHAGWSAAPLANLGIGRTAANPNQLSVVEWLAVAANLPADDDATAVAIAQIPGWTAANLANLAAGFAASAGADLGRWTQVARVLPDREAETAQVAGLAAGNVIVAAIAANRLTGPDLTALLAHPRLGGANNLVACFSANTLTSGAHLLTLLDAIGAGRLTGPHLVDLLRHPSRPSSQQLTQLVPDPKLTGSQQLLDLLGHGGLQDPAQLVNILATGVHSGTQVLDLLNSPYYTSAARNWNDILDYLQNHWAPIQDSAQGGGGGFAAGNSAATFTNEHLGADAAGAVVATERRTANGRGMPNTVLIHTDQEMQAKVLAADDNDRERDNGPVWAVSVTCRYRTVDSRQGGGGVEVTEVGDEVTGDVWLKVYFDYGTRRFSITGVFGPA